MIPADELERLAELVAAKVLERIGAPQPKVPAFVSARDVQAALGCSKSAAYRHLRFAAGRPMGTRKMLRVSTVTWARYAARTFDK